MIDLAGDAIYTNELLHLARSDFDFHLVGGLSLLARSRIVGCCLPLGVLEGGLALILFELLGLLDLVDYR